MVDRGNLRAPDRDAAARPVIRDTISPAAHRFCTFTNRRTIAAMIRGSSIALCIALVTTLSTSLEASAARRRRGAGIHRGVYLYGAPGVVQIPLEVHRYADLDPTWGWGLGVGYLWTPSRYFKIGLGGTFEHTIYNWEHVDRDAVHGNMLKMDAELRIGGGGRRVWGYGLVAPGLSLSLVDVDDGPDDTDAGFNLHVGGGVQGAVWRSLFLGGEIVGDLNWFPAQDDTPLGVASDYRIHQLWLKFMIGWYF